MPCIDAIMEYLEGTLPSRNTDEQNTLLVRHILTEIKDSGLIISKGEFWFSKNVQ